MNFRFHGNRFRRSRRMFANSSQSRHSHILFFCYQSDNANDRWIYCLMLCCRSSTQGLTSCNMIIVPRMKTQAKIWYRSLALEVEFKNRLSASRNPLLARSSYERWCEYPGLCHRCAMYVCRRLYCIHLENTCRFGVLSRFQEPWISKKYPQAFKAPPPLWQLLACPPFALPLLRHLSKQSFSPCQEL